MRIFSLGTLGDSTSIYNQVIAQGGTPAQAEAAARSGSLQSYAVTTQPVVPDWFNALYYAPAPNVVLNGNGVAPYANLPNTNLTFGGVPWTDTIFNPHTTTALDWITPNVLNRGNPKSIYDPEEYLRSALIDSDWQKVFYWFAYHYQYLYKQYSNWKDAFFPFANINILSYKYVVNDQGQKVYYPFSQYDLWQFLTKIVANFSITDIGTSKCAIGLLNWGDPNHVVPYDVTTLNVPNQWYNAINQGLLDQTHPSSVFQYTTFSQAISDSKTGRTALSPIDDIRVGWIQAPKGPWTFEKVLSTIVIIVISYYAGAAIGAAFSAGAGTVTSTGVSTATSGVADTAVGSTAAGVTGAGLDEVVVTGTLSTAAVSTAGVVAAVASVPVAVSAASSMSSSAPATSSAPAASNLDEVVVTGTPVASTVVSTTGAVAAVATVPVVAETAPAADVSASQPTTQSSTQQTSQQSSRPSTDNLDEVVVTGTPTSAAVSTGGVIAAVASVPVAVSTVTSTDTTSSDSNSSNQNSNTKSLESWLKNMISKYGLGYVQKYLKSLLTQKLGRAPTASELQQATDALNSEAVSGSTGGLTNFGLIIAAIGAALWLSNS